MKKTWFLFPLVFFSLPLGSCQETETLSYLVIYRASEGGAVNEKDRVMINVFAGGSTYEVVAKANDGYSFFAWSDGLEESTRFEKNVFENIELIAYFVKLDT